MKNLLVIALIFMGHIAMSQNKPYFKKKKHSISSIGTYTEKFSIFDISSYIGNSIISIDVDKVNAKLFSSWVTIRRSDTKVPIVVILPADSTGACLVKIQPNKLKWLNDSTFVIKTLNN